jgi:hypothetical protein
MSLNVSKGKASHGHGGQGSGAPPTYVYIIALILIVACIVFGFTQLSSQHDQAGIRAALTPPITKDTISYNPEPVVSVPIQTLPPRKVKKKIAYAITVTKDGHFLDGALVLGYSALKVHNASKGRPYHIRCQQI